MLSEMPKKYWHNMPEAADIPEMIASARSRESQMRDAGAATPHPLAATLEARKAAAAPASEITTLAEAKAAIQSCRLCPLYCHASQAVFGEGPPSAGLMIVGEQPGDEEDIAGRPFVGPAGKILNEALGAANIHRRSAYIINAVKHFKFKLRGKRRLHERPNAREIDHCRWWLKTKVNLVKPKVIVVLGASAARAMTGETINISERRGRPIKMSEGRTLLLSYHPAYILRAPSSQRQAKALALLRQDLEVAQKLSVSLVN